MILIDVVILGIQCFVIVGNCIISVDVLCLRVRSIRILMRVLNVNLFIVIIVTFIATFFSIRILGLLVILTLISSFITCFITISIDYGISSLMLRSIMTQI